MRWPYVLFFSSSCFLYVAGRLLELLQGALGWNTLTSKKASWRIFQKPLARTSSRAPSSVLVEASLKDSPDSGCRCGSMATLGQTSVSREAVRSLISLWRIVGKLPMWQTIDGIGSILTVPTVGSSDLCLCNKDIIGVDFEGLILCGDDGYKWCSQFHGRLKVVIRDYCGIGQPQATEPYWEGEQVPD